MIYLDTNPVTGSNYYFDNTDHFINKGSSERVGAPTSRKNRRKTKKK